MASTWSALKVELLETGANAGSWGTLTNANLGDAVLGEAITGQATVDFATDADVTITLTDAATTQAARNLRLNITESSTGIGSVRNLILGSGCQIEKFYLINNTGTGAKTVKNTSGTGISVPAGKATLVYNNGTNVVDAASYFTSLTLGSALPITSGGTGSTSTTFVNAATNVTGILPVANGGTATATPSLVQGANVTITGTWPNQTIAAAAPGTGTVTSVAGTGTVNGISLSGSVTTSGSLTLGGTLSGVNLASQVTGTLPIANGGTGTTSTTFANLTTNVTGTLPIANGGTGTTSTTFANLTTNVTGTLPVGNGGTGATTLTANNVILGNGTSAPLFVAPSSSGNVLTSNGSTWTSTAPAGGGSLIFLSVVTASNSATVDIETTFDSTYQNYVIVAAAVKAASSGQNLLVRQKQSGTYRSADYYWHLNQSYTQSSSYQGSTANPGTSYKISDYVSSSSSDQGVNLVMYVLDPANSSTYKGVFCIGYSNSDNINVAGMNCTMLTGVGQNSTAALTGIRFFMSSGNISSGTFRLYGIKNS